MKHDPEKRASQIGTAIGLAVLLLLASMTAALLVSYGHAALSPDAAESDAAPFLTSDAGLPTDNASKDISDPLLLEPAPLRSLAIETTTTDDGTPVFSITADDFIDSYNGLCWQANGQRSLLPYDRWYSFLNDTEARDGAIHRYFITDRTDWSLPTLSAYTTADDRLLALAVCFDQHSYKDAGYAQFREMCLWTLRVFLSAEDEARLTSLRDELIASAYAHVFLTEDGYMSGHAPYALYCAGAVGIYPYFAIGEPVRICFVPITEDIIADYRTRGTEIVYFQ